MLMTKNYHIYEFMYLMGIGGELVSEKERLFIERLDQLIQERRTR